ncbi:hypothetical protein KM043_014927 [Ampulex compressa]|nr:hypothetical protein KM043_014927 [Ampulex compressa]
MYRATVKVLAKHSLRKQGESRSRDRATTLGPATPRLFAPGRSANYRVNGLIEPADFEFDADLESRDLKTLRVFDVIRADCMGEQEDASRGEDFCLQWCA